MEILGWIALYLFIGSVLSVILEEMDIIEYYNGWGYVIVAVFYPFLLVTLGTVVIIKRLFRYWRNKDEG